MVQSYLIFTFVALNRLLSFYDIAILTNSVCNIAYFPFVSWWIYVYGNRWTKKTSTFEWWLRWRWTPYILLLLFIVSILLSSLCVHICRWDFCCHSLKSSPFHICGTRPNFQLYLLCDRSRLFSCYLYI